MTAAAEGSGGRVKLLGKGFGGGIFLLPDNLLDRLVAVADEAWDDEDDDETLFELCEREGNVDDDDAEMGP